MPRKNSTVGAGTNAFTTAVASKVMLIEIVGVGPVRDMEVLEVTVMSISARGESRYISAPP